MFGIALKPCDRGKAAFKKGTPSTKNPFPHHHPPRNDDDRWYMWRQGWRRAELDAIIAKEGTCAGKHQNLDTNGKIHDIGGKGWVSLDPDSSSGRLGWAPMQCTTCGEIWSMDMVGYDHEVDMEAARNAKLGHSFPKAAVECVQCGMRDSDAKSKPCPNRTGEETIAEWLDASRTKKKAERTLAIAVRAFDKVNETLPTRPCPNTRTEAVCGATCHVCEGKGTIGNGHLVIGLSSHP